jgi:hypothetical protein
MLFAKFGSKDISYIATALRFLIRFFQVSLLYKFLCFISQFTTFGEKKCLQDSLLLMIMPVLGELAKHGPKDPTKKKSVLGLCEKPAVSKVPFY